MSLQQLSFVKEEPGKLSVRLKSGGRGWKVIFMLSPVLGTLRLNYG